MTFLIDWYTINAFIPLAVFLVALAVTATWLWVRLP